MNVYVPLAIFWPIVFVFSVGAFANLLRSSAFHETDVEEERLQSVAYASCVLVWILIMVLALYSFVSLITST